MYNGLAPATLIELNRRLETLNSYDMWFVAERIQKDNLMPASEITKSISLFKQFAAMFAAGYPNLNMPIKNVDAVWHTFILFTEEYADFCDRYLGKFLHHKPTTSRTIPGKASALDFFEVYEQVFGQDLRSDVQQQATCCGGGSDCRTYPGRLMVSPVC